MKTLRVLLSLSALTLLTHCEGAASEGDEQLSSGQELHARSCLEKCGAFDGGAQANPQKFEDELRKCLFGSADGGWGLPGFGHHGDGGFPFHHHRWDGGHHHHFGVGDGGLKVPQGDGGLPPPPAHDGGHASAGDGGTAQGVGGFMQQCMAGCTCKGNLRCLNPDKKPVCPATHTFCVP